MTTTDTDALDERIERAVADAQNVPFPGPKQRKIAAAVLPTVAEEVRKAKAEALRELSAHISEVVDNAKPWQVFTEHVLHEAGACDYLDRAAAEYETGDSDEHR